MTNFSVWSQRRLFCQKPEPTQFGRSRSPRPGVGSGASDFRSRSRPKKVAAPQQWDPDSQKINADLQPWPGRYGEKYEFILFFKSSWCKIANSARNWINSSPLQGQSNEIFDLQFFSSFEPVWATDQCVKIFSILVQISRSYSKFRFEKIDSPPRGMIPREVKN